MAVTRRMAKNQIANKNKNKKRTQKILKDCWVKIKKLTPQEIENLTATKEKKNRRHQKIITVYDHDYNHEIQIRIHRLPTQRKKNAPSSLRHRRNL